MMPAQLSRPPLRNFVRTGKACITSAIMTEDSDRERQGMPNTSTQRPTRTDLISALPENACSDFAGKNPAAFRVFAACVKLADAWGTLYHSAADIGEAIKLHRANVGSALRALIAEGWAEVKASSPGKTPTISLIGPKITQTGGTSALYVMSNSPEQASETTDRAEIIARVDAQAQQSERAAMPQPDAHAQPPAPLPFVAPAQQPDAQAQPHQTRRRNNSPDAQAQQPDAQAQQPDAQALHPSAPLEPPLALNDAASGACVRERAHATPQNQAAAAKMRGDGKPRPAQDDFEHSEKAKHPLALFLREFLSQEQTVEMLQTYGPDSILRALEAGTAADSSQPWTWNRLHIYAVQQQSPDPVDAKIRRIRAVAPVFPANAERFARKHPTAYIVKNITEKQKEAREFGEESKVTPQKLGLALKCNDANWCVKKHLEPIAAKQRAFVERIHSGEADRTRRAVEAQGVIDCATANAKRREEFAAAVEGLTPTQTDDVRAMVRDTLTARDRRTFDAKPDSHLSAVHRDATLAAVKRLRSGEPVHVPEPENAP